MGLQDQITTSDYILNSSREYSIYVCKNRAIPCATDGLKDAQRKALWLMRSKAEKIKTYSLAGLMGFENLYVHGEASACNAISLLAAPFCNNVTLLEGVGSFGTRVDPNSWGAPRYTYVRRNKAADAILYRDLDIVPLTENYDGSTMEPMHFLPLIPTVLLNGVSGVAVGWSTEILPRKLKNLITATQQALAGKKPTGLEPHYAYLDLDVKHLEGSAWLFSGKAVIEDTSTVRVTELPPDLTIESFKKRLDKLEEDEQIAGYKDRSTKMIDILIKFKRGSIKGWTPEQAVDFFKLRQRITERLVAIDWDGQRIRQFESAEQLVTEFAAWRLGWYTTRYQKKLDDDSHELRYWKGIDACFKAKLPARLGGYKDKSAVVADVGSTTAKLGLDDAQVDKIASLPSYRWAKDFHDEVKARIKGLQESIAEYKAILASPERLRQIFHDELEELKKAKI